MNAQARTFRLRPLVANMAAVASMAFVLGIGMASHATAAETKPAKPVMGAKVILAAAKTQELPEATEPLTNASVVRESKSLVTGKSDLLPPLESDIIRYSVSDPSVADATRINRRQLYLVGKKFGSTTVIVWQKAGPTKIIDVSVNIDGTLLQEKLGQLLPNEKDIHVTAAADSVVLSGVVSDATTVAQAAELAEAYVRNTNKALVLPPGNDKPTSGNSISVGQGNTGGAVNATKDVAGANVINLLQVTSPQQVMLEVKVAEISKSILDRFGINFARAYAPGDGSMLRFLSGIFGGVGGVLGQVTGTNGAQVGGGAIGSATNGSATGAVTGPIGSASIGGGTTTVPLIAGSGSTSIGIDAQKNDGLVKILAEPTIMAISGQEGSFLAGGKIFIPVSQNSGGGTSISLEEKEFGVSVRFTPTVLSGGRINLVVRPEVSELSRQGVGISAPGINGLAILPSFTTRKAFTTVQLFDGQSFAIGGLIKNNVTTNIKAFPILGEIPVLGALFRSSDFQTDRSELVFVITARLVKPLPPDYTLPTDSYIQPGRGEFFLGGKMEGTPSDESKSKNKAATGFEVK